MCVYLSVSLFIYLSICLSVCVVCASMCLSVCMFVCLCLFVCLSVCLFLVCHTAGYSTSNKHNSFLEAPQIAVAPTAPTTLNYGAEISLQCAATGIPTPQITWLRDSQELKFDDNRRSIDIDNVTQRLNGRPVDVISNLMIRNITDEDDGVYKCNVSNSQGWTSATVRVKVDVAGRNF